MENEKKNNGTLVGILIGLIIALLICIGLFATGTISFKHTTTDNNEKTSENNEITKKMTEEEATTTVKNIFTNSTVQYLVDHISVTYCKTDTTIINEKELGLDYQWNGYYKCADFNSYEQLISYFKQYVTEEYFNSLLLKENTLKQKFLLANNGTEMYNYYEKDGNLYAANTGKGSNMVKYKFLDDETVYKIDSFDDNQITATITAKWEDPSGTKYSELEKMTIVNENGNWKVSSYDSTEL